MTGLFGVGACILHTVSVELVFVFMFVFLGMLVVGLLGWSVVRHSGSVFVLYGDVRTRPELLLRTAADSAGAVVAAAPVVRCKVLPLQNTLGARQVLW